MSGHTLPKYWSCAHVLCIPPSPKKEGAGLSVSQDTIGGQKTEKGQNLTQMGVTKKKKKSKRFL